MGTKKTRSSKGAVELQAETLEQIARLFQDQAAALRMGDSGADAASIGPAAAEDVEAQIDVDAATADAEESPTDDVAESLEWVTDEWRESLEVFLDNSISEGAGQRFFELYEAHNYNHAAELLTTCYRVEFEQLARALLDYRVKKSWIVAKGGNESQVPQALQSVLYPLGWHETRLKGHLVYEAHIAEKTPRQKRGAPVLKKSGFPSYESIVQVTPTLRQLVVDAHKIDHVKGRVAFDMEWNSKDQTFDRDLYAMRLFHEAHLIGAGVVLTRSKDLNPLFKMLETEHEGLSSKYGASTTWMGKLLYRLRSSRSGGCPVLALGIRESCVED